MPWKRATTMSQRKAFIEEASREGVNISELCRGYGISRKTGYKWLKRYRQSGIDALQDRSRRPKHSPTRTVLEIEQLNMSARADHRILKLARTIVDLAESPKIQSAHLAEALHFRQAKVNGGVGETFPV